MRLSGQTAVVTGGGRGIGRAIALAVAREGANVVVNARTPGEVAAVVEEIRALGGAALAALADVTVAAEVERLVAAARSSFGAVDILINNAGGMPSELYDAGGAPKFTALLWEEPEAIWGRIIDANLNSVFLCCKAVIPGMLAQGHGEIVNIASQAARVARNGRAGSAYAVAKTAVVALTQILALQAGPQGVRVNAVSPGLIATPGNTRLLRSRRPDAALPERDSAESVASAVLYLLCDAPRSMNGQSLDTFGIE